MERPKVQAPLSLAFLFKFCIVASSIGCMSSAINCSDRASKKLIKRFYRQIIPTTCAFFESSISMTFTVQRKTYVCNNAEENGYEANTVYSLSTHPSSYTCSITSIPPCNGTCRSTTGLLKADCFSQNPFSFFKCQFEYRVKNCDQFWWSPWIWERNCDNGQETALRSRRCMHCTGFVSSKFCQSGGQESEVVLCNITTTAAAAATVITPAPVKSAVTSEPNSEDVDLFINEEPGIASGNSVDDTQSLFRLYGYKRISASSDDLSIETTGSGAAETAGFSTTETTTMITENFMQNNSQPSRKNLEYCLPIQSMPNGQLGTVAILVQPELIGPVGPPGPTGSKGIRGAKGGCTCDRKEYHEAKLKKIKGNNIL